MSAPASREAISRLLKHKAMPPQWLNPCEAQAALTDVDDHDHDHNHDHEDHSAVLGPLKTQLGLAHEQATGFVQEFLDKALSGFGDDELRDSKFAWLPSLPRIDTTVPADHLANIELSKELRSAFTTFQNFAVGMEQIVWDRVDDGDDFKDNFIASEGQIRLVLCELLTAMQRLGVEQPVDVSRDIMDENVRLEPIKDLRDWIIHRDYINALKYTEAVVMKLISLSP